MTLTTAVEAHHLLRMFKYVVLVALMVPAILAETTGIKTCRNGAPQPAWVSVEGCDSTPCSVYLNSNANMQLSFVARKCLFVS